MTGTRAQIVYRMKKTLRSLSAIAVIVLVPDALFAQQGRSENKVRPLEQLVGYYDVGTKPNKPFFKSRWYLKDGELYTIYDSDIDRKFTPYENGRLSYNVFVNPQDVPKIDKDDTTYYAVLTFNNDRLEQFRIIRPRSEWKTDLYGYRIKELDALAVSPEKDMTSALETKNFRFVYTETDESFVREFSQKIETIRPRLLKDFQMQQVPLTTFKIYPDLESYHNGVLIPGAPEWQQGRVWTESEIKLVSPSYLHAEQGEVISDDLLVHEYIHILHWNKMGDPNAIPKWLWEGVALYKGCCSWGNVKALDYLDKGDYPSLREINWNSQMQYELGYYLVEFIVTQWGWDKILDLITSNGDIKHSLGMPVKKFEEQFYQYMQEKYFKSQ